MREADSLYPELGHARDLREQALSLHGVPVDVWLLCDMPRLTMGEYGLE